MENSGILIAMFFLILLSGLFSGSESALLSLEDATLRTMKEKKIRGVDILEKLKSNPKRLIITILLGNNVVNILLPVLATVWGTTAFSDSNPDIVLGFVTGGLTFILLLFGEILPKNFAITHNQKFSIIVAPFLFFLGKALFPIIWVFEKISDKVTPDIEDAGISEAEVLAMVAMSEENGEITLKEKTRIKNLLNFSDTLVSEVMTPRTKINGFDEMDTLGDAKKIFKECPHSRMPVYEENIDSIKKIMTLRDIWEASEEYSDEKLVKNLELRTPYFVPITKKISDLFEDFQRQQTHLAIVLDEHGGTAGLITMEDIFEEIFGEIRDETDHEEESESQNIQAGVWKISPRMTIEEIFEETKIAISEKDEDQEKNLSFFVLEKLGRFPRKGETIEFSKANVVIEKMEGHSVELFRIVKK
ncbi:TPA: HlyC/CorC family transporter [Candidatus Peregrinibacteria bacterium]|nr:HlyC/CorC family transporter [Candidatus Peregrinibacteria bacterium]